LTRAELFGASAGGLRLDDPGADLAMAVALASAGLGSAPRPGAGFVGEVSLTGAVRPVGGVDQRILAARAAGLGTVVLPGGSPATQPAQVGMRLVTVDHLRDALSWAFSGP
jgi:DNA repair protein RadA/Sms